MYQQLVNRVKPIIPAPKQKAPGRPRRPSHLVKTPDSTDLVLLNTQGADKQSSKLLKQIPKADRLALLSRMIEAQIKKKQQAVKKISYQQTRN